MSATSFHIGSVEGQIKELAGYIGNVRLWETKTSDLTITIPTVNSDATSIISAQSGTHAALYMLYGTNLVQLANNDNGAQVTFTLSDGKLVRTNSNAVRIIMIYV